MMSKVERACRERKKEGGTVKGARDDAYTTTTANVVWGV